MAKKKIPDFEIPFNENGNVMSYADTRGYHTAHEWKKNFIFQRTLEFSTFDRGRSAAHAIFVDPLNDQRFPMFLTDLADAIPHLVDGKLTGDFTFCKRGANYATKFLVPDPIKTGE